MKTEDVNCSDCECPLGSHNAVNEADGHLVAHCGKCGACWTEKDSEFVARLREWLLSQ